MGVADEKLQPMLPNNLPAALLVLAHACCDFDPEMRPPFSELVPELEQAVQQLQVRSCSYAPVHVCCWHLLSAVALIQNVEHMPRCPGATWAFAAVDAVLHYCHNGGASTLSNMLLSTEE
jgi:hypothetical protein